MVRLKVSYESMDELTKVINMLGATAKEVKIAQKKTGKFKRAYIDLISLKNVEISRDND